MRKLRLLVVLLCVSSASLAQISGEFDANDYLLHLTERLFPPRAENYIPGVHFPKGYGENDAQKNGEGRFLPGSIKAGDSIGFQSFKEAEDVIDADTAIEYYTVDTVYSVNNRRIIHIQNMLSIVSFEDVWAGDAALGINYHELGVDHEGILVKESLKRATVYGIEFNVRELQTLPAIYIQLLDRKIGYLLSAAPNFCKTDRDKRKK